VRKKAEKPDPIQRGFFRQGPDGAVVFFPWGLTHRGHRLPDEAARRRASRAASLLMGAVVGVGVWGGHALDEAFRSGDGSLEACVRALAAPLVALALAGGAYALWVTRFTERLAPSDLVVSREERLREAAALAQPARVAAIGAILAVLSALLVGLEPRAWWLGALGALLGLGLVAWARALRRAARGAPR
jgi:hypothetical protein